MANLLPWILALAFALLSYSEANDLSCSYRDTDGSGDFTFDDLEITDPEFTIAFKVLANSDVNIILSPLKKEDPAAYVITIGANNNELTTIRRYGGEVLKSYSVTEATPFRESELRCYDSCMNAYYICFENGMIRVGRQGESAPYFSYDVPEGETFNPKNVGFGTGSTKVGLFADFLYDKECRTSVGGSDIKTTTTQPRDCVAVDCSAVTCLFGFKKDARGCDSCECKDSPCETMSCAQCKHGYVKDEFHCDTCECIPGPCDEEPCQNNGYCYGVGTTDYGCICTEGYDGDNCENDVQNPTITCPIDMITTTDPQSAVATITYEPATGSDNSGVDPSIVCSPNSPTLPVGVKTVQCIATDGSSNTASCTYTITVNDEEPPTPKCPVPMDEPTDAGVNYFTLQYVLEPATDNADPNPAFTCEKVPGDQLPLGTTTITCTATDKYANSESCNFEVTVKDEEDPEFDCPLPMDNTPVDSGQPDAVVNYQIPGVTDNVDEDITVECNPAPGSKFPIGHTDITCTSTDKAGNTKTCPFYIEVVDDEGPTIECPIDMSQPTDSGSPTAVVTYDTPVAVDNNDPNPTVVCDLPSGSKFPVKANEVVCTATDNIGNSEKCTFTITVNDEEPPTPNCPIPMDEPTDEGKAYFTLQYVLPAATDNADPNPAFTCEKVPGDQLPIGTTTITCTATDKYANSESCNFEVTVKDEEKPKIRCPLPMPDVLTDPGKPIAVVPFPDPSSSDNADPDPTVVCNPPANSEFPIGTTRVKCTSTDDAGNFATCPFEITVSDEEKPKLSCREDPLQQSTDPGKDFGTVDYETPSATDNADDSPAVTCQEPSGSEFSLGTTTVTCTAFDNAGNEESCTFDIVVVDEEKPKLECPLNMTEPVDAGEDSAVLDVVAPEASDNADLTPDVVCTPPEGQFDFQLGPNPVSCIATDNSGNFEECTYIVTVEDNEGPTIKCPLPMPQPADLGSTTTAVTYNDPIASDNSDPNPVVSCTSASGSEFGIGETNVTCTATDDAGNSNECSFKVIVTDAEPPSFECPADMIESMEIGKPSAVLTYTLPVATDNWDSEVAVVCTPASGSTFKGGSTTVVCSASDDSGNKNNCTFTIEVQDTEKPEITCPIDMEEFVDAGKAYATLDFDKPAVTDNAALRPKISCDKTPEVASAYDIGTTTVTCTAVDDWNNSEECSFTIKVTDNEKPKITCPIPMDSVPTDGGQSSATVTFDPQSVSDNADPAPIVFCEKPSGSEFPIGKSTVQCTATDKYKNSQTCQFYIIVEDKEKPKITCPIDMTPATDPGAPDATVTYPAPTVTDNDAVTYTCSKASGSKFSFGPNVVLCTAKDTTGNEATCTFQIDVKDEEKPRITCPNSKTMRMDDDQGYSTISYDSPTASDNLDTSPDVLCTPPSSTQIFQIGPTTVRCNAEDDNRNSNQCEFTITVKDDQKPKLTCPVDMSKSADGGQNGAYVYYNPVAIDNFDGSVAVICSINSGTKFLVGEKTVTCSATDSSTNKESCSFTVTITDDEAPSIDCIKTKISQTTDPDQAYASINYELPTASDNADPSPTVSCDKVPGSQFTPGTYVITCTATDDSQNSASCPITITVTDKEPPKLKDCPVSMLDETDTDQSFATVVYTEPTATDNVDKSPIVSCNPPSNSQFDIGTQMVTCTATDSASNVASCDFNVQVKDKQKPEVTCPIDMSKKADPTKKSTYVSFVDPRGSDNSGLEPSVKCDPPSSSEFFIGDNTVTCTATDAASNHEDCSFTITVTDEEPPTVFCTDNKKRALDAGKDYASFIFSLPTASDNFDHNLVVTCDLPTESTLKLGLNTIVCRASDTAGNEGTCSFVVRVTDDQPPVLECPDAAFMETEPGVSTAAISYTVPTANDNVDGSITASCSPDTGDRLSVGENTITCSASDSAGNTETCLFPVTIEDKEQPSFDCPLPMPDVTVDTDKDYATVTYTTPEVSDNVDENLEATCIKPSGSQFPIGESTVTCRASDVAGNSKECSFPIKVGDDEAPEFDCPLPMLDETDEGESFATVTYPVPPTASDSVDGEVPVTCTPARGTPLGVGVTTVTCQATDSAGNVKTCPFDITVEDKEKPKLTCPKNMLDISTDDGQNFAVVTFLKSVEDNVDKDIAALCDKESGAQFPIGTSVVTCSATDTAGNPSSCSFKVGVVDKEDPVVKCPIDMNAKTDPSQDYATVSYPAVEATDNTNSNLVITCDKLTGSQFPIGPNAVTCTTEDNAGNVGSCTFNIDVVDEELPTVTCPDKMDGQPTDRRANYGTVDYVIPTGSDNADASPVVSCDKLPGSKFDVGSNTVTCTVTDKYGNSNQCTFDIEVVDEEKPQITCPLPMPDVTTDDGAATALVGYNYPTATDNVDPSPTVICTPEPNTQFPIGDTTVRCKAVDSAANKKGCNFIVTVTDDEDPKMTCPVDMGPTTDLDKDFATVNYDIPLATDNVDTNLVVDCQEPSGSEFSLGETTVICSVTDSAGNTVTCLFKITVTDEQQPELDCPHDMTEPVDAGEDFATVTYTTPIAIDNADPAPDVDCQPAAGSQFGVGPNEVICTADDESGNSNTCKFNIIVEDNEGPTIKCPIPMPEAADLGGTSTTVDYDAPEVSDNTDPNPDVTCTQLSGTVFEIGDNEVTCTATDDAGNSNKCSFSVIVKDAEPPQIECPVDMVSSMDPGESFATVTYDLATAIDNWDANPLVTCFPTPGSVFNAITTTVVCSAVDAAHNKNNCTFSITIEDNEKPEITCPVNMDEFVEPGRNVAIVEFDSPTATDNADPRPTIRCNSKSGAEFEVGTTTVTCRAIDASDNRKVCKFDINVKDNEPPKFKCPASLNSISMDPGKAIATVGYILDTPTDNADPAPTVVCNPAAGSEFPLGTTTVTCTASDIYANSKDCSFQVVVIDDEKPEFDCPVDMDAKTDVGVATGTVTYTTPTANDNVDGEIPVTCTPESGTVFSVGVNIIMCTSTDSNGNTRTCPFNITVKDEEKPKFDCPVDMSNIPVDPNEAFAIVSYPQPDGTDNVDSNIQVYCVPEQKSRFPIGTTEVTCAATDKAKNSERCSFDVTVVDDEGPKFTCPIPMVQNTDPESSTAVVYYNAPIAEDNADGPLPVTCEPASGSTFPFGVTTVQCSVTDSSGNVADSCQVPFTITVEDKEKPKVTCPINMDDIPSAPGDSSATVDYTVQDAQDNVDGIIPLNCNKPPGSKFPIGTTTVLCTATDASTNSASCSFTVQVVDEEKPEFDCPIDMTQNMDKGSSTAKVTYTIPTATDNKDGSVPVECVPASGSAFGIGTTTVKCTAVDSAGNKKICPFTITVEDKEKPELDCPVDMTDIKVDAGRADARVVYPTPEATDNVGGVFKATCVEPSGSKFPIGNSTVRCSATDQSENSEECTFKIQVKDNELPSFECPVSMTEPTDAGVKDAVVTYPVPTANDNADGSIPVTCTPDSGSTFPVGTTSVLCSATDSSGNTHTCPFPITVEDRELPKFDCTDDMHVFTDSGKNYATVDYPEMPVTDNVDSNLEVTCVKPSGSQFGIGDTKVTCSATDSANNKKTCTFTVYVTDKESPEFECPVDMSQPTDAGNPTAAAAYTEPTSTDNVDGIKQAKCLPAPGKVLPVGPNTITCTATDSVGNSATCTFTLTVEDKEPPKVVCPIPMKDVSVDPGQNYATVNYPDPTAEDNVDCSTTFAITCVEPQGSQFPLGESTVTCTTTDMAGNPGSCSFTITVVDDEAPKFTCLDRITQPTDAGMPTASVSYTEPTATDNVDSAVAVSCTPAPSTAFEIGTNTVTCTSQDSSGNKDTCSFEIVVEDKEAPKITCPIDMDNQAPDQGATFATLTYPWPTVTENSPAIPTVTCDVQPGAQFSIGTTTVTCTASDPYGNAADCSFTVEVKDVTPPNVNCPADMTFDTPDDVIFQAKDVTAIDDDGTSRPVTCDNAQIIYSSGANSITCRASDASGNEASCSFNIIIDPPVCAFPTEVNGYNYYAPCATPLKPNHRTKLCFTGSSESYMYVGIWDRQSPMYNVEMLDLMIDGDSLQITLGDNIQVETITGFKTGDTQICVERTADEIILTHDDTPLFTQPTSEPLTEIGFASSLDAYWITQSVFGSPGASRRRRSVDDSDPIRAAVKRRRRQSAADVDLLTRKRR